MCSDCLSSSYAFLGSRKEDIHEAPFEYGLCKVLFNAEQKQNPKPTNTVYSYLRRSIGTETIAVIPDGITTKECGRFSPLQSVLSWLVYTQLFSGNVLLVR